MLFRVAFVHERLLDYRQIAGDTDARTSEQSPQAASAIFTGHRLAR
ncbi:MAG TPA: hypothetical protein VME66_11250 [Candidatus Acidoferrales bacterium]|nr:hypothetical protein [Candidatus Acidoferrales bacterium]